jgi:hypothetical protein
VEPNVGNVLLFRTDRTYPSHAAFSGADGVSRGKSTNTLAVLLQSLRSGRNLWAVPTSRGLCLAATLPGGRSVAQACGTKLAAVSGAVYLWYPTGRGRWSVAGPRCAPPLCAWTPYGHQNPPAYAANGQRARP